MIQNKRAIGEEAGYFTGLEVEHSQFYGLDTIFFNRHAALRDKIKLTEEYSHIFIALINPKFWLIGLPAELVNVISIVTTLLAKGKKVTIEADTSWSTSFVEFRLTYPKQFCLMLVVEVPQIEAGGFCLKAAPTNVFQNIPNEGCVMTAGFDKLSIGGASYWAEYAQDQDGEL